MPVIPDYAGLRSWTKARSTGTQVGVYDGEEAHFDTAAGRWQTVCEPHGNIISHQTLALAMAFRSCPEEWCDRCNGGQPVEDECFLCGGGTTCRPTCPNRDDEWN